MKDNFKVRYGQHLLKNKCMLVILLCVFMLSILSICTGCSGHTGFVVEKTNDNNADSKKDTEYDKLESNTKSAPADDKPDGDAVSEYVEGKSQNDTIVVYVCGAVNNSGVYEVQQGSRICDAVNAAGGMSADAAPEQINLATIVSDGEQIRVPFVGEEAAQPDVPAGNGDVNQNPDKINLNTATKEQLMTLSGIGESKANAIISYREKNGRFYNIEELKKIEGIKEGVYNKIKDNICVK